MKMFSAVMALVIAIFISGNASAATWEVAVDDHDGVIISIDKDSIKRGTDSKEFPKFNRKDGFSAVVKISINDKDVHFEMTNLISFYEKDGKRMYCLLDSYDKTEYKMTEKDIEEEEVDVDGRVWKDVWAYIEKNLK